MRTPRTLTLRYLSVVVTITLLCLLCSCVTQRVQTVVPAFSQAVSTMTSNTKAAFEVAEQKYEEAQAFTLAVNYRPGERFDPTSIRVLLSEEDLDARVKLLAGLEAYGSQLEAVADGADKLNNANTQLGYSLQTLAESVPVKTMASTAQATAAADSGSAAVNSLGDWLIERKLRKNLPDLISRM
jgi:hypothetical protein